MNLKLTFDAIYALPPASLAALEKEVCEVSFRKGHHLLRSDRVENSFFFIKKGIARAYAYQNENEITFWFGKEGDAVLSMRSYTQNKPGYETVELLEDSDLYQLHIPTLKRLFGEDIHIANWGRRFAELELTKLEERFISRQFRTASECYSDLVKNTPDLLQRVKLGHIASYLGITQVSLSRIRAEYD